MNNRVLKSIVSIVLVLSMLFSFSTLLIANAAETKIGVITTTARLRSGPGTNHSQVLDKNGAKVALYKDDVVTIYSEHDSSNNDESNPIWYKVSIERNNVKYEGYVSAGLVVVKSVDEGLLENVPEEYKPYIEQLLANHPNWNFVFYDTGLDWDYVLSESAEGELGRNVVQHTFPLSYRSTQTGAYNWRTDKWYNPNNEGGWYQANTQVIAHYMDPRNFLNETNVFMFEALSYDEKTHTLEGVKKLISKSFMNDVKIKDSENNEILYAQAYMNAAQISKVSPYHLAARTVQEVGYKGSGSTSGTYIAKDGEDLSGYYNFYNICAYAGSDPISYGLKYARGDGVPDANKTKYLLPWDSQYKAIVGGAKWIGNGYINNKQDTLYYQKFNVVNKVWWHQYMANVMAPYSESKRIRNNYYNLDNLDNSFTFLVPYYRNMPENACPLPEDSDANPNNWLSSLTINDYSFGFDAGKTSGYQIEVPATVETVTVTAKTVNSKAKVNGTGTITLKDGSNEINVVVTAENGTKRTYKVEIIRTDDTRVALKGISLNKTSLSMFKGDTTTLKVSYNPSNTTDDKTVKWSSSDTKVATVSGGKITAVGEGEAIITAKVGSFSKTCKVTVSSDTDIKKGDVDADGNITLTDALMIFKYKSEEISLSDTALKAADTDGNNRIELLDALRIFKYKSGEIDEL